MTIKKILLVEGRDDEHVLKHFSSARGGPHFDEVRAHEGVANLLDAIPVYLKAAGDSAIVGIVVDADADMPARWQALRDRIVQLGYSAVPDEPVADGTILDPSEGAFLPRVGIWVMPDNQSRGILEDFLRFLIPADSQLFEHVTASVASISDGERRFSPAGQPKALIHTWLSWQEEPGKPLGTAITARYLDANLPQGNVLAAWLQRLFV